MKSHENPATYGEIITINVDVQNDFALPAGALSVPDGEAVIEPLNLVNEWTRERGGNVVFTRDWHPEDTAHFDTHGGIWPPHCIQNRAGAAFHDSLIIREGDSIGSKGMSKVDDGYSGWEARFTEGVFFDDDLYGMDGSHAYRTSPQKLESHNGYRLSASACETMQRPPIAVIIGGIATDYCVKATALDAVNTRLPWRWHQQNSPDSPKPSDVYLLMDAIRAVNTQTGEAAIAEMLAAGVHPITSQDVINGSLIIDRSRLER